MNQKILKFEILGIIFISLFGSLLHFVFDWAHRFWLVGAFSAVNESSWEHLKLAIIPAILWAFFERQALKIENSPSTSFRVNNFWCAKTAGIWLTPVLILVFFYSYTAILGYNLLPLDISTFILAVIFGQIVSYKIMISSQNLEKFTTIFILSIVVLFLVFVFFTYLPPHFFLFQDPVSGGYGII